MTGQTVTGYFNELYDSSYNKTLRYVTAKCKTNDIADIVQEIYTEVYAVLVRKGTDYIENEDAFVMQVTKAKVYRYYSLTEKLKNVIPLFTRNNDGEEEIAADFELSDAEFEDSAVNKLLTEKIWQRLSEKPETVKKVFYLYYSLDLTIPEIAKELSMSQSSVKNKLYRTVKEIRAEYETAAIKE